MIYLVVENKKSKKNHLGRGPASDAFVFPKKKAKKAKKTKYVVVNYKEPKCWAKRLFCL